MVLAQATVRAMAKQLDRVNARDSDADLRDRMRELVTENERLRKQVERLRNMISAEHRALLDHAPAASMLIDGRPVLTPEQAASQVNVSVSTVSRYIRDGFWHATQQPGSNRWFIFADEPLPKKRRK